MGAGVSGWRLARAVSATGQLGVVSGTGLDRILARRLEDGDPEGHFRRALDLLPFPGMARRILDRHFVPGGKAADAPYRSVPMHTIEGNRAAQELCIAANFVEVTLARETHNNPVGINYLEKIQLPHLPSIYGAMLAGVAVVIVGAGIPLEVPDVLDALAGHQATSYPVTVSGGGPTGVVRMTFNPQDFWEDGAPPPLKRPDFLPIVSSDTLARMLHRRAEGGVAGFVVEHHCAGGHNAPPRGPLQLTAGGEPAYGPRDTIKLEGIRKLGLPFWLAGAYATPERVREALADGASGVQVGSAFALCRESGLVPSVRRALVRQALQGTSRVFTDGRASPTGFPFKVVGLEGTLSEETVYLQRKRICDLGFLREPYVRADGSVGYRCAAEPEAAFVAKGGRPADAVGRRCLCNALVANVGMPQVLSDGRREPCLVTLGDDLSGIDQFCTLDEPDYMAADVIRVLRG
jgi:nitronate monooxygenase